MRHPATLKTMPIPANYYNALQYLLNICYDYAEAHDITYNTNKSVCMHITCTKFKMWVVPSVIWEVILCNMYVNIIGILDAL